MLRGACRGRAAPLRGLRCYFVEEASAEEVGARFGYTPATVHQLAAELRAGRTSFFRSSKPGPKGPHKTHTVRDRVLVLLARDRSVTEIAEALTAEGNPVSAQTVWAILKYLGLDASSDAGRAGLVDVRVIPQGCVQVFPQSVR